MKGSEIGRIDAEEAGRILVVDDDPQVRALLGRLLVSRGYHLAEAPSLADARAILKEWIPDVVILDLQLGDGTGLQLLEEIRCGDGTRLLPVIMLTGSGTREARIEAFQGGVTQFMDKPFDGEELLARLGPLVSLKFFTDELEHAEKIIISLAKTIDARDPYTAQHSVRVSMFAGLLGRRIGLKGAELMAVRRGGLFHDLGKIAIRDAVLLKPGKLTPEEYAEIKRHPGEGRKLVEDMKTLAYAREVIHHHHERWDGSGYPDGLAGEAIPLVARVATIADIYDALTSERIYRKALTDAASLEIMEREAKRGWWDRRLLEEFRGVLKSSAAVPTR